MNYIIEWNEDLIKSLNVSGLGKSSYGPLPKFGLTTNIYSRKPVYLYFKGATQRENIFIKGTYHYSPPMIDTNIFISAALFPKGRAAEALYKAMVS